MILEQRHATDARRSACTLGRCACAERVATCACAERVATWRSHLRANASQFQCLLCMALQSCPQRPRLACVRDGHVFREATRDASAISSADGKYIPAAGVGVVSVRWDA